MAPESILTVGLLLFGATAVFVNVRGSLNKIWDIGEASPSKTEIVLDFFRGRLRGMVMIALTGVVVAAWFLVTAATGLIASTIDTENPSGALLLRVIDASLSFLFIGALFAAIYRTLPATRIGPGDVVVGALATAILFLAGKSLVAWLIASAEWTSYYGPGASVVAFLAWIYFSAQLFFLGAEFTWVWSRHRRARRGTASPGP
jgi:membrane protein